MPEIKIVENSDILMCMYIHHEYLRRTQSVDEESCAAFASIEPRIKSTQQIGSGLKQLTGNLSSIPIKCVIGDCIYDDIHLAYELKLGKTDDRLYGIQVNGDDGTPPLIIFCLYGKPLHDDDKTAEEALLR